MVRSKGDDLHDTTFPRGWMSHWEVRTNEPRRRLRGFADSHEEVRDSGLQR
ncbi:hypothetical protein F511_22868 [Dorcoceras hygrometricum]|uniref:Uncharacterized protein n=1 Tax=Dorcoceras hygrometricum TaxID=472368 RepID=A0A2Z7AQT4_9LAMI|nr:hypothetical protein F511_22868 [Dorcoceras hygrometricum]